MRFSVLRNDSGSVLIVFAFVLPVMLGATALAVDAASLFVAKGRLQTAADAASLGAALIASNTTDARARAVTLAAANVPANYQQVTKETDVQFGTWNSNTRTFTESTPVDAVKVTAGRSLERGNPIPLYFAGIFSNPTANVTASAVAAIVKTRYCVIALETTKTGFSAGGSGKFSMPNCGLYVNSSNTSAATVGGNASVVAQNISVVGGYSGSNFAPTPQTNMPPIADPLASLPQPTEPTPCTSYSSSSSTTLNPGCYTSIQLSGNTTTVLNPGLYFIKDGTFNARDSHRIIGTGVTIYLNRNSSLSLGSSGTISLSAPTSGVYKDILIFGSRNATNATIKFGGSSDFLFSGTVYAPTSDVVANGSASATDVQKSGSIIAKRISFTGTSDFRIDQMGAGISASGKLSTVSLVH